MPLILVAKVELPSCRLVFWDLGGQVRLAIFSRAAIVIRSDDARFCCFQSGLRSIWDKYYREADSVVFVIDCSEESTLNESMLVLGKSRSLGIR